MGVLQSLRECDVKANGYATMCADCAAGKSMTPRLGVSRATKHIQLRFLYSQALVSVGVARMRKVPTKDNIAGLHTKFPLVERQRYLCELHYTQSITVYYNIHASMDHHYHVQLAHHYRMTQLHDCSLTHIQSQSSISYSRSH